MTRAQQIAAALSEVRARLADAVTRAGRPAGCVRLIAVSKKMSPDDVRAALAAGQQEFGENYAQELRDKRANLESEEGHVGAMDAMGAIGAIGAIGPKGGGPAPPGLRPRWHYLGPIQSNKVKYLAGQVALIQSLDDADILTEIDRRVAGFKGMQGAKVKQEREQQPRQECLIQVNVAAEPRKGGVPPHRLSALLDRFATATHSACVGLMLIPPLADDASATRRHFAGLREISEREAAISRPNVTLSELSMGMSSDFVEAVAEGATMVRVGTAIFGARAPR